MGAGWMDNEWGVPRVLMGGSAEPVEQITKDGEVVPPEVKLAIALRFYAGGAVLDLMFIYHVSKSFVYDCVWLVSDAVNVAIRVDRTLLE